MANQADGFEKKAANIFLRIFAQSPVLAGVVPKKWDAPELVSLPRASVRVMRDKDEMVYRTSIYRAGVVFKVWVKLKDKNNDAENLAKEAEKLLFTDPNLHEAISGVGMHFYALEPGGVVGGTEDKLRVGTLTFSFVGVEI